MRTTHPLDWIIEPLQGLPTLVEKKMFGCRACYIDGLLKLVLASGEEPWNGILVPCERQVHHQIVRQLPELKSHAVLGKWLYISEEHCCFEEYSRRIIQLILDANPLIGIIPKPKRKKQASIKRRKGKSAKASKR